MKKIRAIFFSIQPLVLSSILSFFTEDPLIKINLKDYNNGNFKKELLDCDVIVLDDGSLNYGENNLLKAFVKKNKNKKILYTSSFNRNYIKDFINAEIESIVSERAEPEILKEAIIKTANGEKYIGEFIRRHSLSYIEDQKFTFLSSREKEIIILIRNYFTNKQIAEKLFISIKTVEVHKENIKRKLNIKSLKDLHSFYPPRKNLNKTV